MRADIYLSYVRIFKTRSLSTQACNKGNVRIKAQAIKPAREVRPGDILEVERGELKLTLRVLDFPERRLSAKLVCIYMEDMTPPEIYEKAAAARREREYTAPHELAAKPDKKQMRQIREWMESNG
jgi:ribosome-associated heat shock protein Hsp15